MTFGKDLPMMRDWVPDHFDFAGYIIGEHPQTFGSRAELRAAGLATGPMSGSALSPSAAPASARI